MKYYKIKDIIPPCIVTFEKHNGKAFFHGEETCSIDKLYKN